MFVMGLVALVQQLEPCKAAFASTAPTRRRAWSRWHAPVQHKQRLTDQTPSIASIHYASSIIDPEDDEAVVGLPETETTMNVSSETTTDDPSSDTPIDVTAEEPSSDVSMEPSIEKNTNDDTEPTSLPSTSLPTKSLQENISFLQTLGAISGRGEFATPAQKHAAETTVQLIEAVNPTESPTTNDNMAGTWELVYCSTQLFRSSPFFMAGRAVCATPESARQYNWFCDMHRAALSISQITSVRQIVNPATGRLVSEFCVAAGAVPFLADLTPFSYSGGLPLSITGALVSSADITPADNGTAWLVYMDTVQIKGSNIPGLRQVLDTESVRLPSRSLANVLEQTVASYTTPKPIFRTTYLDDQYRISRDQDDHIFVYVKTSSSTEPTDFRNVDADLGIGRLLEGFNDAVTRFYL
jgi:PAP_fibrillin